MSVNLNQRLRAGATALLLGLLPLGAHADPDSDWAARSGDADVVMATRFDAQSEVNDWIAGSNQTRVRWVQGGQASGNGALRFDILREDAQGSGNWRRWLADDQRTFGEGDEYYVQYRVWIPQYLRDHVFPGRNGATNPNGWKTSIISHFASSFQNNEVVIENSKQRGYIQGYNNGDGSFDGWSISATTACWQNDFRHQPAIDRGPQNVGNACENDRARYGGLFSYNNSNALDNPYGPPDPLTGAFIWYPDEWITLLQHVRINSLDDRTHNNLIEVWAARASDSDYTLLVSHQRALGGAHGGHNALWLTPFHTNKCSYTGGSGCSADPNRQDTFMMFDEVIVSTSFIPAPGAAAGPQVTISASPTSVPAQGTSTLTWSAPNADSCFASGSWSGTKNTSGSEQVGPLAVTGTFALSCSNSEGSTSRSVTVTVAGGGGNAPTVDLSANPNSVPVGGTATLDWTSTNAVSCSASDDWSGARGTQGSEQVGPLNADADYTLTCTGAGGSTSDSVTIQVVQNNAPTVNLSATPSTVASGEMSLIEWSTTNATSCTASGAWTGSKGLSGSEQVGPLSSSSTYSLNCSGAGGSTQRSATVTVTGGGGGGGGGGGFGGEEGSGSGDPWLLAMLLGMLASVLRRRHV